MNRRRIRKHLAQARQPGNGKDLQLIEPFLTRPRTGFDHLVSDLSRPQGSRMRWFASSAQPREDTELSNGGHSIATYRSRPGSILW
jgi:hypothetical protein